MKITKLLIVFLFLSLKGFTQTITSSITITQTWVNDAINNPRPWTISGTVTVTFGENLTISDPNQFFIIYGDNVTIDGAGKTATISGVTSYPSLVNAAGGPGSPLLNVLIKDIGVHNINSTLISGAGYIASQNNTATIINCYSTGPISEYQSGGIAGAYNDGNISNCYSTGVISGNYTGGIVGVGNNYGNISNCYSRGDISGSESGGIAAYTFGGLISNCYSTGTIDGYRSGGIVGYASYGNIQNCYSSGRIFGDEAGGISPQNASTISNSRTSGTLSGTTTYDIALNVSPGTFNSSDVYNSTPTIANTWDNSIANQALTGEDGTIWNTSNTPYTLMSFLISPILTVSLPNTTFLTCLGSSSLPTTFDVTGSGLTASVTISAPSDFEISTSSGGTYSSSLTLTNTPTVSQTLYVRLNSSASIGDKTGTITATTTGASDVTTTVSGTVLANPTLSTYSIIICKEATYLITKTTDMSLNGSWAVSGTITVNNGYVTAGTNAGNYVVSYTDGCATVSATVAVGDSDISPAITGQASYKINNTIPLPQGPTASLYVGYNGFNYYSSTPPTKTGFYKANNQSGNSAGCPYPFEIFRCTTCPDPVGPR
jgi:hypothetical protein